MRSGKPSFENYDREEAKEFSGVIIDEITRADISQVFGPLYTAIEDNDQVIFRSENGGELTLNNDVKLICTLRRGPRRGGRSSRSVAGVHRRRMLGPP
jgi:hypothetical protein